MPATTPRNKVVLPSHRKSLPFNLIQARLAHGRTLPMMTPTLAAIAAIKFGR